MYLEVTVKSQRPLTFRLSRPLILVGSLLINDIVINDPSVSKNHLKIYYQDDKWWVLDEGSTNGSFVGNEFLQYGVPKELKTFSDLRIGDEVYIRLMDIPFHARVLELSAPSLENKAWSQDEKTRVMSLEEFEAAQGKAAHIRQARRDAVNRPFVAKTRPFTVRIVMTLSMIFLVAFIMDKTWRSNGNLARDSYLQLPKGNPLWRGPGGQIHVDKKKGEEKSSPR